MGMNLFVVASAKGSRFSLLGIFAVCLLAFQNCSPTSFEQDQEGSVVISSTSPRCKSVNDCLAISETTPGTIKGPDPLSGPMSCTFNGQTVESGKSVKACQESSVAYGKTCQCEDRRCDDGVLSGSYNFATCEVSAPRSCIFQGKTIPSGGEVKAFENSTEPFGKECRSEVRKCTDGLLSGSFTAESCSNAAAANCTFDGKTVLHGNSVKAFVASSVPFGQSCGDGNMRTCNNGVLSGQGEFASCNTQAPLSCLFGNRTIAHGETVPAYREASVAFGGTCQPEDRKCSNGVLSGSFTASSCIEEPAKNCSLNGQTVKHGDSIPAYFQASVPYGQTCQPESRKCTNGVLSGSATIGSCVTGPAANCSFNGQTVLHGKSVPAYASASVPFGQTCVPEDRKCTNGVLSGSYQAASCAPAAPANCWFDGGVVAHNSGVTAYAQSVVSYGSSCASVSQPRSCYNGSLSGSYPYRGCQVEAPAQLWTWTSTYHLASWQGDGMQKVRCDGYTCPGQYFWIYGVYQGGLPYAAGSSSTSAPYMYYAYGGIYKCPSNESETTVPWTCYGFYR